MNAVASSQLPVASEGKERAGKERPILFSGEMVRAILDGSKTQTRRVCRFRITGPNPPKDSPLFDMHDGAKWIGAFPASGDLTGSSAASNCPKGQPGDRLWVRERLQRHNHLWRYAADNALVMVSETQHTEMLVWATHKEGDVCASIHMPRWASRLTPEITKVRVERVQEISEADAYDEGIDIDYIGETDHRMEMWCQYSRRLDPKAKCASARGGYAYLWDKINAKPRPVKEKTPKGWLVTHYESYPWSEESFAALYPEAAKERVWRKKPLRVYANPWVWVIEFKKAKAA